jgi:hypothetical protein
MTPREFRQEQGFEFDHFQELTSTGIKPNYVNIELFAHEYHKAKIKLLGIGGVVQQSELLSCETCKFNCDDWDDDHPCANCAGFEFWEAT